MEKNIKMSLETARQMYKEGNETTNKWLLENFTKEELEPKKGFTLSDCVYSKMTCYTLWPLNEKYKKSMDAFSELSHIVNKYNEGKEMGDTVFSVDYNKADGGSLQVNNYIYMKSTFEFNTKEDALISMEVNRQLWLDYWMID